MQIFLLHKNAPTHLSRHLCGRLEQRSNVNVVAEIRKAGRNHLGAAVVAVLTHLGDQHARATTLLQRARARRGRKERVESRKGKGFGQVRFDQIVARVGEIDDIERKNEKETEKE